MWSGWKCEISDGADLGGIDPGALQIIRQADRGRLPLADAGAGVDHDQLVADLQHDDGQRDRHIVGGHAGLGQRGLGLVDAGVLDEGRIVRLPPNAVVEGRDLHRADLVLVKALARVRGGLGCAQLHDGETGIQAEGGGKARAHNDITTRHVEHGDSLSNGCTPEAGLACCGMAVDRMGAALIPDAVRSASTADHDRVSRPRDERDGTMTGINRPPG